MATDDAPPGTYADDLARLHKATAKVHRAQSVLDAAKDEAAEAVAAALRSAVAEGRNRTEVQKYSPFSPPTVRKIGEDAGIPPDERYVRTSQPPQATADAPLSRPMTRADELRAIVRDLSDADADRIADGFTVKHGRMLTVGKTSRETIDNAIRANLVTASDLR